MKEVLHAKYKTINIPSNADLNMKKLNFNKQRPNIKSVQCIKRDLNNNNYKIAIKPLIKKSVQIEKNTTIKQTIGLVRTKYDLSKYDHQNNTNDRVDKNLKIVEENKFINRKKDINTKIKTGVLTNIINEYKNETYCNLLKITDTDKTDNFQKENISSQSVKTLKSKIQNKKIKILYKKRNKMSPYETLNMKIVKEEQYTRLASAPSNKRNTLASSYKLLPREKNIVPSYTRELYSEKGNVNLNERIALQNPNPQRFKFTEYVYDKSGVPQKRLNSIFEDEHIAVKGFLQLIEDLKKRKVR